jgi:hypothetical protein
MWNTASRRYARFMLTIEGDRDLEALEGIPVSGQCQEADQATSTGSERELFHEFDRRLARLLAPVLHGESEILLHALAPKAAEFAGSLAYQKHQIVVAISGGVQLVDQIPRSCRHRRFPFRAD